jgi:hypothetical protein
MGPRRPRMCPHERHQDFLEIPQRRSPSPGTTIPLRRADTAYSEGHAARDRNEPFGSAQPRQSKVSWLLAAEEEEVGQSTTYHGLLGESERFALDMLNPPLGQLSQLGWTKARIRRACARMP